MTKFGYKVIIAICRIVLKVEERTNIDSHDWIDIQISTDRDTLRQAIAEYSRQVN